MKRVLYTCSFVPPEWIAAHGLHPCRLVPARNGVGAPASSVPFEGVGIGVCPYARAFLQALKRESPAAVVFTTVCDQMRRLSECAADDGSVFLLHVPATWQSVHSQRLYRDELGRLGQFLVDMGGAAPADGALATTMIDYDQARRALLDARPSMTAGSFAQAVARLHESGPHDSSFSDLTLLSSQATMPHAVRLALVGGPLPQDDLAILDSLEAAGAAVVLDATQNGERTFPARFNRQHLRTDPFAELADAYFGAIPDAFRRPNSALYRWLKREFAARQVQGIVLRRYVWCDTWHAEVQRMAEWADIPLLALDVEDGCEGNARTASRIEAFVEALR